MAVAEPVLNVSCCVRVPDGAFIYVFCPKLNPAEVNVYDPLPPKYSVVLMVNEDSPVIVREPYTVGPAGDDARFQPTVPVLPLQPVQSIVGRRGMSFAIAMLLAELLTPLMLAVSCGNGMRGDHDRAVPVAQFLFAETAVGVQVVGEVIREDAVFPPQSPTLDGTFHVPAPALVISIRSI